VSEHNTKEKFEEYQKSIAHDSLLLSEAQAKLQMLEDGIINWQDLTRGLMRDTKGIPLTQKYVVETYRRMIREYEENIEKTQNKLRMLVK
jgi:hypothetical protein